MFALQETPLIDEETRLMQRLPHAEFKNVFELCQEKDKIDIFEVFGLAELLGVEMTDDIRKSFLVELAPGAIIQQNTAAESDTIDIGPRSEDRKQNDQLRSDAQQIIATMAIEIDSYNGTISLSKNSSASSDGHSLSQQQHVIIKRDMRFDFDGFFTALQKVKIYSKKLRLCRALQIVCETPMTDTLGQQHSSVWMDVFDESCKDMLSVQHLQAEIQHLQEIIKRRRDTYTDPYSMGPRLDAMVDDIQTIEIVAPFFAHADELICHSDNMLIDIGNSHHHSDAKVQRATAAKRSSTISDKMQSRNGYPQSVATELQKLFADIVDFKSVAESIDTGTSGLSSHVLAPHLLIWACFAGRFELANLFWRLCRESIEAGLLCSAFCRSLVSRFNSDKRAAMKQIMPVWWSIAESLDEQVYEVLNFGDISRQTNTDMEQILLRLSYRTGQRLIDFAVAPVKFICSYDPKYEVLYDTSDDYKVEDSAENFEGGRRKFRASSALQPMNHPILKVVLNNLWCSDTSGGQIVLDPLSSTSRSMVTDYFLLLLQVILMAIPTPRPIQIKGVLHGSWNSQTFLESRACFFAVPKVKFFMSYVSYCVMMGMWQAVVANNTGAPRSCGITTSLLLLELLLFVCLLGFILDEYAMYTLNKLTHFRDFFNKLDLIVLTLLLVSLAPQLCLHLYSFFLDDPRLSTTITFSQSLMAVGLVPAYLKLLNLCMLSPTVSVAHVVCSFASLPGVFG
eukprot:SAG31_NODE_1127_length_9758_cov_2.771301_8_plen_736_part_00